MNKIYQLEITGSFDNISDMVDAIKLMAQKIEESDSSEPYTQFLDESRLFGYRINQVQLEGE